MKAMSLIPLALCCSCLTAWADVQVEGPVEYGVFDVQISNPQPGERVLSRANQPIRSTEVIPARLGTKFGVRYQLRGKSESETPLTLLYFTPGLTLPDGRRQDKIEVTQKLLPGAPQDVMAYEFTEVYEAIPGEWRFMVFQGERKLLEQRFEVR